MKILTSRHNSPFASKPNGFTLIELMITVAIIGILASVAYPSYQDQVRKSRRSDAVQGLAQLQQGQERYRANNVSYGSTLAHAGITTATTAGTYYTLAISASSAAGYTATATAVSGKSQASDTGCTTFTVTVANGTASNGPASCWSK